MLHHPALHVVNDQLPVLNPGYHDLVTYCFPLPPSSILYVCVPCCQGVPDHKSYVVLFKYYGGGEVDYFEVASSFGVQDSVAEPTSAGE